MKLQGILLAAGASSRFGGNKLVQSLPSGTPVLLASALRLTEVVDDLLIVVAPDKPATLDLIGDRYPTTICPDAKEGMGHSIAHGVRQTKGATGWLLALADMPYVESTSIAAVANAMRTSADIARPAFEGRAGHPVAFGADYGAVLMRLKGDAGANRVVNDHASRLITIDVDDPGVLHDIDRPTDIR